MEEPLGAPLLVRSRQGVTPTPAGRTLLQHARTILRQSARMREDLGAYAGGLSGQVRLLSNTNALTEFLPEALSSFLADHPHVSVDLEERLSRRDRRPDRRGRGRPRHRRRHRRCGRARDLSVPLATASCWWWRATIRWPARARSRFAQVLDHDFVGLDRPSALQRFLAGKAAREGQPLRLRVQLRSFDAVCRLVECNVGIGIVPETTARAGRRDHGDRRRRAHRRLGAARTHHLRPRLQRIAALCAATGRASAIQRLKVGEPEASRAGFPP